MSIQGPNSTFKELDMKAPIRQQLANIVILEFPVVFVFLPSHSINFEVIKNVNPSMHKSLQKDSEANPSQEGVSFREEAIEDNNSSTDPKVFDLMKRVEVEPSSSHQVLAQNTDSEKASNDSLEKTVIEGDAGGNPSDFLPENKELKFSEDMALDFDQDFINVCADLMADMNPEDFLDFNSEFAEKAEDEIDLFGAGGVFPMPEELEEGEILE